MLLCIIVLYAHTAPLSAQKAEWCVHQDICTNNSNPACAPRAIGLASRRMQALPQPRAGLPRGAGPQVMQGRPGAAARRRNGARRPAIDGRAAPTAARRNRRGGCALRGWRVVLAAPGRRLRGGGPSRRRLKQVRWDDVIAWAVDVEMAMSFSKRRRWFQLVRGSGRCGRDGSRANVKELDSFPEGVFGLVVSQREVRGRICRLCRRRRAWFACEIYRSHASPAGPDAPSRRFHDAIRRQIHTRCPRSV